MLFSPACARRVTCVEMQAMTFWMKPRALGASVINPPAAPALMSLAPANSTVNLLVGSVDLLEEAVRKLSTCSGMLLIHVKFELLGLRFLCSRQTVAPPKA